MPTCTHARLCAFSLLMLFASAACMPELPPCDRQAALDVAFLDTGVATSDDNGLPMYTGQALIYASCSSAGECHAQSATGGGRYGAPAGMWLDIGPRCIDGLCDADTTRFARARTSLLEHGKLVHAAIERETMPPGAAGRAFLAQAPAFYMLDDAARAAVRDGASLSAAGERLPSIDDARGREIVANWIACGAPVVELTATPRGDDPGSSCAYSGDVGSCVHRVLVPFDPPEPTFDSIYERYLRPSCAGCHGPGTADRREDSALDLSTPDLAYDALLAPAAGELCAGVGTRVVPGSASTSLLLDKLGPEPACGEPMGGTRGAPAVVLDAIRTWIDRGAMR